MTRSKAIRLYCIDCSGGSYQEVADCEIEDCPLYAFRTGHSGKKKVMSAEHMEKLKSALGRAREAKKKLKEDHCEG